MTAMMSWWLVALYGAAVASLSYTAGARGWSPAGWLAARWRRWRTPPEPKRGRPLTLTSFDVMLDQLYPRDEHGNHYLPSHGPPIDFGKIRKTTSGYPGKKWVEPVLRDGRDAESETRPRTTQNFPEHPTLKMIPRKDRR